jgi:hypothetical protein
MFISLAKNIASAGRIKDFSTESLSVINVNSLNMLRPLCVCVWGGGGERDRKLLVYTRCLETLLFYYLGMVNKTTAETIPVFVTFYILQADFKETGMSLSTECTNKIGHFYTYTHGLKRKFQPQTVSFLNSSSFYTVVTELKFICLDSLVHRPGLL